MATIGNWTKLGAVVRDARRARNLSQADAATRAGVSRSWLARVEAGHRGAELEPLLRLFSALDLTLTLHDSLPAQEGTTAQPTPHAEPAEPAEQPTRPEPTDQVSPTPTKQSLAQIAAMQSHLEAALQRIKTPDGGQPQSGALRRADDADR